MRVGERYGMVHLVKQERGGGGQGGVHKVLWGEEWKKKPFFERSCAKQTNCRKLYRMLVTRVLFDH